MTQRMTTEAERRTTGQKLARTQLKRADGAGTGDSAESGPRIIGGYGAVFYSAADPGTQIELWTDTYERIMPGAFDRSIAEGADVVSLFNHDDNNVLGRTTSKSLALSVDAVGLLYGATENTKDPQWASTAAKVERGDVTGASFMFFVRKQEWSLETLADGREIEVRSILDVDLVEVGPVTFPWYPAATAGMRARPEDVASLRSQRDLDRNRPNHARKRLDIDYQWVKLQQRARERVQAANTRK